jgi:hypothetical protein
MWYPRPLYLWQKISYFGRENYNAECMQDFSSDCFSLLHDWKIKRHRLLHFLDTRLSLRDHISRGIFHRFVCFRQGEKDMHHTRPKPYHSGLRAEGEERSPKIRKRWDQILDYLLRSLLTCRKFHKSNIL